MDMLRQIKSLHSPLIDRDGSLIAALARGPSLRLLVYRTVPQELVCDWEEIPLPLQNPVGMLVKNEIVVIWEDSRMYVVNYSNQTMDEIENQNMKIEEAAWHPLSPNHICILSSNMLKMFNLADSCVIPECTLDLMYLGGRIVSFTFGQGGYLTQFTVMVMADTGEIWYGYPIIPKQFQMKSEFFSLKHLDSNHSYKRYCEFLPEMLSLFEANSSSANEESVYVNLTSCELPKPFFIGPINEPIGNQEYEEMIQLPVEYPFVYALMTKTSDVYFFVSLSEIIPGQLVKSNPQLLQAFDKLTLDIEGVGRLVPVNEEYLLYYAGGSLHEIKLEWLSELKQLNEKNIQNFSRIRVTEIDRVEIPFSKIVAFTTQSARVSVLGIGPDSAVEMKIQVTPVVENNKIETIKLQIADKDFDIAPFGTIDSGKFKAKDTDMENLAHLQELVGLIEVNHINHIKHACELLQQHSETLKASPIEEQLDSIEQRIKSVNTTFLTDKMDKARRNNTALKERIHQVRNLMLDIAQPLTDEEISVRQQVDEMWTMLEMHQKRVEAHSKTIQESLSFMSGIRAEVPTEYAEQIVDLGSRIERLNKIHK